MGHGILVLLTKPSTLFLHLLYVHILKFNIYLFMYKRLCNFASVTSEKSDTVLLCILLVFVAAFRKILGMQARNYRVLRQRSRAPQCEPSMKGSEDMPPRKFWISWSSDKLFPVFWGMFQQEMNLLNSDTITAILQSPKCNPVPVRQHDTTMR
jgi:hypothetical protein